LLITCEVRRYLNSTTNKQMIPCRYPIVIDFFKKGLESYILGAAGRVWRGTLRVQNRVNSISKLSVRLYSTQGTATNSIFKH